jgi:hypothetical protein
MTMHFLKPSPDMFPFVGACLQAMVRPIACKQAPTLDRLLKQRSALRKPDFFFDLPPPRGGLRSLSVGAVCHATKSRALSELLS